MLTPDRRHAAHRTMPSAAQLSVFLCGDVMTGRGIDQILPCPSDPGLFEGYIGDARDYVELAERVSGPIPRGVDPAYVWGDALDAWRAEAPGARLVNLETSITTSEAWWPKGINYRMHPANVSCLAAAGIDACALANNHVLDWGYEGLLETLATLERGGIAAAGAGRDLAEAAAPAIVQVEGGGRVLLVSLGCESSGIPAVWAASRGAPGVNLVDEHRPYAAIDPVGAAVRAAKRPGDVAVASVHWGGNWGYEIPRAQVALAHALVDHAGVDVVHGHSSHHPRGIEVYRGRPILYGCGDFLNDYEGIRGHERYRADLVLMYFVTMDPTASTLARLRMAPMRIRRFRLGRVAAEDAAWLAATLTRAGQPLGTGVEVDGDGALVLRWE